MKSTTIFILSIFTLIFFSAQTKIINTEKSSVTWKGYKVLGSHEGTIKINAGGLTFKGSKLIGGSVAVDMNSIVSTDLEGDSKTKLENHLKDKDFFDVNTFPKVSIVFKNVTLKPNSKDTYNIKANLMIKGIVKPIEFDLKVSNNSASSLLKIDRSLFGLTYGSDSSLGNKMIKNEFDINAILVY